MATTSDGDEGQAFVDQISEIEELMTAARASGVLTRDGRLWLEMMRLALISLNRIANSLAGIELSYAALCDHLLPEPPPLPLEHEP
jgi:hypothetical protein